MFKRIPFLAGLALLAIVSSGATAVSKQATQTDDAAAQLAEVCKQVPCRKPTTTYLDFPDGGRLEIGNPGLPYVDPDGVVVVLSGETISVELSESGGKITGVHYVPAVKNPAHTLTFELKQLKPDETILTIHGNFSHMLKYDALMEVMKPDRSGMVIVRTSTCPMFKEGFGTEMWPHPVAKLTLQNFRFLPYDSETIACE